MKAEIDSSVVKRYGMEAGASVVGIASSKDFGSAPDGFRPAEVLEGCLSVIVLGVPMQKDALTGDKAHYTEVRNAMVKKMTDMANALEKRIKKDGYRTKAISSVGGKFINGTSYGPISLKHAAELAGLGQVTRNYLLTNDQYGNLLWISAVLTDAELVPDKKVQYDFCKDCNKCVETCPVGALDDPASFKKKECARTCYKLIDKKLKFDCYLCRTVCPHGFGK